MKRALIDLEIPYSMTKERDKSFRRLVQGTVAMVTGTGERYALIGVRFADCDDKKKRNKGFRWWDQGKAAMVPAWCRGRGSPS